MMMPAASATPESPLRIALLTETFPPDVNGVARTLRLLADGLSREGHAVTVIHTARGNVASNEFETYKVLSLPVLVYPNVRVGLVRPKRLGKILEQHNIELLYIATEGPLGQSAVRAAAQLGIPCITGYHTNFDHYTRFYRLAFLERLTQGYLNRFHNRSALTLTFSKDMITQLRSRDIHSVALLRKGVDLSQFNPKFRSAHWREGFGVDAETPLLLYVGRLAPEKNIDVAIAAFKAFQSQHPTARMMLTGEGPERSRLERQNPDIIFTGLLQGDDLSRAYASADLFVFPSLSETFGNVVLEAMASGLAVLAFRHAAAAQIIDTHRDGVLVDGDKSIDFIQAAKTLAQDAKALSQLGQAAQHTAQQHSVTALIQHFTHHAQQVLLEHAP